MILKIFLPQNLAKKLPFFKCTIRIITSLSKKNATFCQKLGKTAEICDHNIDPWSTDEKFPNLVLFRR
jgi:hypothetical protein